MVLRARTNLHRVPEGIAAEELTMFEPLANAVHWVHRAAVQLGDTVVIQGPGHQGLACLMAARAAGAGQVIVTGTTADKLRFDAAMALGADAVVDVQQEDPVARVGELTNGAMADVVMDIAAVTTATIPLAVMLARPSGRILLAGLKHFAPVENFISDLVVFKQLTIAGGAGYTPTSMRSAVDLLTSDRIDRSVMVGDVVTLDDLDRGLALLTRAVPDYDTVHVSLRMA